MKWQQGHNCAWYDCELYGTENVVVVPGLGAFDRGYLLLIPRRHYTSMAALPDELWAESVAVKETVRRVLRKTFLAPTTIFEHGAGVSGMAGACIEHAHWHILPGSVALVSELRKDHVVYEVDVSSLRAIPPSSYLFVEESSSVMHAARVTALPGQYLRRTVASLLGRPQEWDYLVYPGLEHIRSTMARLTPWPAV